MGGFALQIFPARKFRGEENLPRCYFESMIINMMISFIRSISTFRLNFNIKPLGLVKAHADMDIAIQSIYVTPWQGVIPFVDQADGRESKLYSFEKIYFPTPV